MMWSLMFSGENADGLIFVQKENGNFSEVSESFQKAFRPPEYTGKFMAWLIPP